MGEKPSINQSCDSRPKYIYKKVNKRKKETAGQSVIKLNKKVGKNIKQNSRGDPPMLEPERFVSGGE